MDDRSNAYRRFAVCLPRIQCDRERGPFVEALESVEHWQHGVGEEGGPVRTGAAVV